MIESGRSTVYLFWTMFCAISAESCGEEPLYPRRNDLIDKVAVEWLPDDVRKEIKNEDPRRFENVVLAIEEVAKTAHNAEAFHRHRTAVVQAEDLLTQVQGYVIDYLCLLMFEILFNSIHCAGAVSFARIA